MLAIEAWLWRIWGVVLSGMNWKLKPRLSGVNYYLRMLT